MPAVATDRKREALEKLRAVALSRLETRPPEEVAAARERHRERNKMLYCYPKNGNGIPGDVGQFSRDKYRRHLEFFRAGKEHAERAFIAGNRIGKNFAVSFEVAFHMTGLYPEWWEGYRFSKPGNWWISNRTWTEVRDTNQMQLLGQPDIDDALGTGSIPAHLIHKVTLNPHIKFGLASFQVRHVSGGIATGQFKAFEQGWQAFEAAKIDGIWNDEICPLDVYGSCKARTTNTAGGKRNGMMILTFTPLLGLTDLVVRLREQAVNGDELGW